MVLTIEKPNAHADSELLAVRFDLFQPKIHFEVEVGNYLVRTAKTVADLKSLVQLRHHSFVDDFVGDNNILDFDFNKYDVAGDHVLVKHKKTGEVIGAYRIICSTFSDQFYNFEEFNIDDLLRRPGVKLELSRAVIHKDYRNGATLNMVWRGLSTYMKLVGAKYIFGCSSVYSVSPKLTQSIYHHLSQEHFTDEYNISVLPDNQHRAEIKKEEILPLEVIDEHIPALLKSYIKAGAKICSKPALDLELKCTDFFTVLDMDHITDSYKKRYFER